MNLKLHTQLDIHKGEKTNLPNGKCMLNTSNTDYIETTPRALWGAQSVLFLKKS